ncbi:MAG: hypothetical protein JSU04_11025 [Bdellovibrionales bacterium]|nr:hypothetical protein [Bdellovibrionales bacterium]
MNPLQEYTRKRNFRVTSEPKARILKKTKSKPLIFVVQEHHASHLHYDFRLELDGVLKSWAVPKGPSTTPGEKRLAVEVEDHPLGYAEFHGDIPEGEYGAGHVEIWDHGTWLSNGDPHDGLEKGHLEFTLKGSRLQGDWMLIRTRFSGKKAQWLLIKRSKPAELARTSSNLTHPEKILFTAEEPKKKRRRS